jgi:endonuclease YncB( thermonuclease family)
VSKPWKPGKQTVELRPSRIRREPVRLEGPVAAVRRWREHETEFAVLNISLLASAVAALVVGVSVVTYRNAMAPTAAPPAFNYCRASGGPNCVVDGDTFYYAGAMIGIAGIDAPEMHPSRCPREAQLGVDAVVRLRELLNRGPVTLTGTTSQPDAAGRLLRKVEVQGVDVGEAMIAAGFARSSGSSLRSWCSPE